MAINSTYTVNTSGQAAAAPQTATGSITFDATAITAADYIVVDVGFTPRYIRFENVTDRIMVEWHDGMADDSCIKTAAAGTRTLEVVGGNKGLTVCDDDGTASTTGRNFKVSQNATLAVIAASKVCRWIAIG
jgi:hypothetical protein